MISILHGLILQRCPLFKRNRMFRRRNMTKVRLSLRRKTTFQVLSSILLLGPVHLLLLPLLYRHLVLLHRRALLLLFANRRRLLVPSTSITSRKLNPLRIPLFKRNWYRICLMFYRWVQKFRTYLLITLRNRLNRKLFRLNFMKRRRRTLLSLAKVLRIKLKERYKKTLFRLRTFLNRTRKLTSSNRNVLRRTRRKMLLSIFSSEEKHGRILRNAACIFISLLLVILAVALLRSNVKILLSSLLKRKIRCKVMVRDLLLVYRPLLRRMVVRYQIVVIIREYGLHRNRMYKLHTT